MQDGKRLSVTLAAADDAPRVIVNDREILLATWCEGVIEIVTESSWLLPRICGVTEEHA
jgi:hypothetical protein